MKVRAIFFGLILIICSTSITTAGGIRPGLRLHGGYGTMSMVDLNNSLDRWNVALADNGLTGVSTHEGGIVWGFDLSLNINRRVQILLSYDQTPSQTNDRVSLGTGFFRVRRKITGKFISLGALAYPKSDLPVYVIAKVGYGFGNAVERYEGVADPSNFQVNRFGYDVDGRAVIGEIGLGASRSLTQNNAVGMFVEGTYRVRNLGSFDGLEFHNIEVSIGELLDDLEEPMDFNYSGFAIRAGIEVFFSVTGADPPAK